MTSLEHVLVKHALDRLSSWSADGDGDVAAVRGEAEAEVEEVGVGVAITTTDDEEQDVAVGIAVKQDSPRVENKHEGQNSRGSMDGTGNGNKEEERGQEQEQGQGSGCGGAVHPRRLSRGVSSVRHVSRSRSRSLSDSNSHSHSHSQSLFHSHSRSQSSMRGPLEMESSIATSWTQADVEGGRAVGDSDSDRQHGREDPCQSSADALLEEHGITVQDEVPRDDTEVVSLSRILSGKDGKGPRDVSRKEEVLVMQEEDIGERWHLLRYDGDAPSQAGGEGEGRTRQVEEDLGSAHPLENLPSTSQSLEVNEKERWRTFRSTGRNPQHLRLEFKSPSPQPWDEVDPPTDNNEIYTSDYYSTLNSKKFETLQKSRQRPLIPHSSYYFGPPPLDSAYGTAPVGQIGVHHPREIVRIERDYAGGELVQFSPIFPLELEGRITPTQFHQTINDINEILISAYSIRHSFIDNFLAVMTLQLSTLVKTSHYTKKMRRLKRKIEELNTQVYNPVGLNILWPQKVAFLFLEIEYY